MIKKRRNDDKGGIKVYIVGNSNDIDPIMCSSNDKNICTCTAYTFKEKT